MDLCSIQLELMLALLGVGVLMVDAFAPLLNPRRLGFVVAIAVAAVLVYSLTLLPATAPAFSGMVMNDAFALFFRRLFLVATVLVLLLVINDADVLAAGAAACIAMVLFAAAGMMLMASSNDFFMLFTALELVTVTFYVLTSYLRRSNRALEAGVKYLTLGTLSSSFLVLGIAFVFGGTGTTSFDVLRDLPKEVTGGNVALIVGCALVFAGLGFKIASVPFQMWAPDVYEGAATPATAFLATGSKAAGFAVLMRLCFDGIVPLRLGSEHLIILFAVATILYGTLGAIGQRNLKRLMGYSSIANAGFLLMGFAASSPFGREAVLYYLAQYVVTVLCAFLVLVGVQRTTGSSDIACLAGLHKRSPLLALALFVSMMSLAGVPPLSGAMAKFFLFGALLQGAGDWHVIALVAVAGVAAVVGLFYYLGVLRAALVDAAPEGCPIRVTRTLAVALVLCVAAILLMGLFPQPLLTASFHAVTALVAP